MSTQENIAIVEALFEHMNAKTIAPMDTFFTDDYQADVLGIDGPLTMDQGLMYTQALVTAFPDFHLDITRVIAQNDNVVVLYTVTGTNTGPMASPSGGAIPPTGARLQTTGSLTYAFKNGKIAHAWSFDDTVWHLRQMDLLPPMEATKSIGG